MKWGKVDGVWVYEPDTESGDEVVWIVRWADGIDHDDALSVWNNMKHAIADAKMRNAQEGGLCDDYSVRGHVVMTNNPRTDQAAPPSGAPPDPAR